MVPPPLVPAIVRLWRALAWLARRPCRWLGGWDI
jgi:hypothetical protein